MYEAFVLSEFDFLFASMAFVVPTLMGLNVPHAFEDKFAVFTLLPGFTH